MPHGNPGIHVLHQRPGLFAQVFHVGSRDHVRRIHRLLPHLAASLEVLDDLFPLERRSHRQLQCLEGEIPAASGLQAIALQKTATLAVKIAA